MSNGNLPVSIVGGYLGSGKTTLINHLLRHCGSTSIAVLVNDFGDLAIDAELIESQDENIISLSGGCVCCSYGNDLSTAVMQVLALHSRPNHIVIESSGVALPGAIAASLSLLQGIKLFGIIVMADAETIEEKANNRFVGDTIDRQLASANLVVLNKCELQSPQILCKTQNWLEHRWPATRLVSVSYSQIPVSLLLDDTSVAEFAAPGIKYEEATQHATAFTSFTLEIPVGIDADELAARLAGNTLSLARAKGFIMAQNGTQQLIQVVGRRWNVEPVDVILGDNLSGKIVCIGLASEIDEDVVRAFVGELDNTSTNA